MKLSIITLLMVFCARSYSQKDSTNTANLISLGLEFMSDISEDANGLVRLNLYYSHPVKNTRVFYGLNIGYNSLGEHYYDQTDYLDRSLITNYPDFITKPDSTGSFIGRKTYWTEGIYLGVKAGLENKILQVDRFYLESRIGISSGVQFANTYQDMANYTIDSADDFIPSSPQFKTFKEETINERHTKKTSHFRSAYLT